MAKTILLLILVALVLIQISLFRILRFSRDAAWEARQFPTVEILCMAQDHTRMARRIAYLCMAHGIDPNEELPPLPKKCEECYRNGNKRAGQSDI